MKIEVGKYYRTRDGRKVGPMRNGCGVPVYDWDANGVFGTGQFYSDTGKADDGHEFDLIAEWTETPEVGTLREIGAKVGDVVQVSSSGGATRTIFKVESGEFYFGPLSHQRLSIHANGLGWRIIRRAKPTGPVITETVTRIVPGVYGKVHVGFDDGECCIDLTHSLHGRAELISARDILSQLIDAMEDN